MKVIRFLPVTGAAILAVFSLAFNSHAQTAGRGDGAQTAQLDRQLAHIERLINNSETARSVSEYETQGRELSESLGQYAKSMLQVTNDALMDVEKAAKSKGKEGSFASLRQFEDLMGRHEHRMKQMDDKSRKIAEKLETLESDSKGDSKKISSIWTPAGDIAARAWLVARQLTESAIPSANAAILIPVVAACSQLIPSSATAAFQACTAATALTQTQRAAATSAFNACWGSAHRHKKLKDGHVHLLATMHTACTAVLVARLA